MKIESRAFLPIVFLIALVLRLSGIHARPIWYDEAFAILFAEKGLGDMLRGTLAPTGAGAADIHPLGYYTLLWLWMSVFGNSIAAARLLSAILNLLSLILVYKIAEKLFDVKTAIAAALLFSVVPAQIHFAQEIRMYAALELWLLLAAYSFLQARAGNWKWWIAFSVSSALAQYTHNLAAIHLMTLALTPVLERDWKTLRSLTLAGFAALVLYLPWALNLPAQFEKVNSFYWVERPGAERLFTLLLFYLPHLPLFGAMLAVGLLCAVLIVSLAAFQTYLAKMNGAESLRPGLWTAYLAFAPPLLLWLVSQKVPVYIERALLPSQAMFCIWLAWAFTQTRPPKFIQTFAAGLVGVSAVMGIYQHLAYKGFPYGPFRELGQSLQVRLEAGDVIVHSSKLSYLPSLYFDPTLPQGFILDPPESSVDTLAPATREILGAHEYESVEQAAGDAKRVWFVIYQPSIEEYAAKGHVTHPHLEYLNAHYELVTTEAWGDLNIYLFVKSAP